jgi:hypothetical protein
MKAIHASSKAFKHLRAVVSLAHDRLGDETCRREDAIFRDADRALAGVRHARVMADMHEAVTSRSGQRANAMAFPPWALVASRIGRFRQQPQTAARTRGTREAEVLVELWPTVGSAPRLIATGVEPAADRTGSADRRFAVLGVMESVRARGCDRP